MNFEFSTLQEIAQHVIDKLNDGHGLGQHEELHDSLFNTDYFIIGRYEAEQWLIEHTGVFNAIGIIQEYENERFGEIYTDLSEVEKVCNMIVYIAGEEVLGQIPHLRNIERDITKEDVQTIIEELKEAYNLV